MKSYEEKNIIYKAYKDFYHKEPNFDIENLIPITIEIQSMSFLLQQYGISLIKGEGGFVKQGYISLELPMDMNIQDVIVEKLIDNNEDLSDDSLRFSDNANRYITAIGKMLRKTVSNEKNPIDMIRRLCYLTYIEKYVIPSAPIDEIMKEANCEIEDIKKQIDLFKNINQELGKDNFDDNNIENIRKQLERHSLTDKVYRPVLDKSGDAKILVNQKSREICAKALLQ